MEIIKVYLWKRGKPNNFTERTLTIHGNPAAAVEAPERDIEDGYPQGRRAERVLGVARDQGILYFLIQWYGPFVGGWVEALV